MNQRSIKHTTFVIERTYGASPARVFAAWADPEAKAQWFPKADEFDFRVGGREVNRGTHEGVTYTYDAHYQDIVPDQRIAYTYSMDRDETRMSVSVTTVEFQKATTGTRLIYTEQGLSRWGRPAGLSRAGNKELSRRPGRATPGRTYARREQTLIPPAEARSFS